MNLDNKKQVSKDEFEKLYSSRLEKCIDDIITFSKLHSELDYRPMDVKEHEKYLNTLDILRDNMILPSIMIKNHMGETIGNTLEKSFRKLLDAGEDIALSRIAFRMRSKGYNDTEIKDLLEYSG